MLIYSNPTRWEHPMFLHQADQTDEERAELSEQFQTLLEEIAESGEYVGGERLGDPRHTTTVRVRDGVVTATDGPYAEAKEHLAGYIILDCATPERAEQIAARFPDARHHGLELRPIMVPTGLEM